jgi:hypothetical protein
MSFTKLAKTVRAATCSEEFDLAGYDETSVTSLMESCFKDPFPLAEMVKLTFTIGGGKGTRGRYDQNLAKFVRSALSGGIVGYQEDQGACCMLSCQGLFKYQHDTGKNLIFMHIFPRLAPPKTAAPSGATSGGSGGASTTGPDPRLLCGAADISTFQDMVRQQVPSWTQKRRLVAALRALQEDQEDIEAKLTRGETLSEEDERLYSSCEDLDAKLEWLAGALKAQTKRGDITATEKVQIVATVSDKAQALRKEAEACEARAASATSGASVDARATKAAERAKKRLKKLKAELERTETRLTALSNKKTRPILQLVPLKNKQAIEEVWAKAAAINAKGGAGAARGGGATMKELQAQAALQKLQDTFETLAIDAQADSWFEDEEEFSARLGAAKDLWQRRQPKARRGGARAPARSAWTAPKRSGRSGGRSGARRRGGAPANPFAGMESSSDDDA